MTEQELYKIGEWLRSMGYVIPLEDDFWMEDWIGSEHKIREICELLHAYASTKVQEALIKHSFDRENEEEHAAFKLRDELMRFREWLIDYTQRYISNSEIDEYLTSLNDGRM